MSFNGSGTFLINTAGQPVVPNTVISATAFNALTNDLANGLSTCITKDGQTTPTANIPMGNNKITGLAPGTSGTDAANLSQVQGSTAKLLQSVTGTDTITAAMVPALTSYSAGQMFYFVAAGNNTGPVTINIDSLGAKSVTRDGSTALVSGDIVSGEIALIVYDGTRFQLLNGNSFTNLNVSGTLAVGSTSTFTGAATFTANPTLSAGTANGVLYLNGSKVATSGSALTFDGTSVTFGSTAQRIIADMSNATVSNRFAFQTSTTNGNTQVNSIPNGTSTTAQFIAYNSSDPNNASSIQIAALSSSTRLLAGQTGTGTYLPITFFTNGVEQARLDTSGNLGIGTTSATGKLTISNAGAAGIEFFPTGGVGGGPYLNAYNRSTAAYIQFTNYASAHTWYVSTAGNSRAMDLDSSGNLGIGTASPGYKLSVAGASGSAVLNLLESGVRSWGIRAGGTATNTFDIADFTAGATRLTIDSSGNLGIGTTSPVVRVHAFSNTTMAQMTVDGTGAIKTGVNFASSGTTYGQIFFDNNSPYDMSVMQQYVTGSLRFGTNNTERGRFTSGGNLLIGTTTEDTAFRLRVLGSGTSAGRAALIGGPDVNTSVGSTGPHLTVYNSSNTANNYTKIAFGNNVYNECASVNCQTTDQTNSYGDLVFVTRGSGGYGERGRFTAGGDFLVGTSSGQVTATVVAYRSAAATACFGSWNAATSGDNLFEVFNTETTATQRGSIDYNRAGGLVRYNTTSDYRAKDVYGLLDDSGETIDALKVYRGKMHGATMERPMLIAHEAQEVAPYAVTGEKDAVNEDGTPKFQQMDTSSLVPLLIAEIQSLRSRVAALEAQ